jgi:tetratricopeptide (TPR) repeat protein
MMEADRALAPLENARAAIDRLDTYTSPQELTEALEAIGQAVERSLRQLLRLDASVPDEVRLTAHDPDALPFERVLASLRQRERVSLQVGNEVHELRRSIERARAGQVRASDADLARGVVERLRTEIPLRALDSEAVADDTVRDVAHGAVERGDFDEAVHTVPSRGAAPWLRWAALAAGVVVVGLGAWLIGSQLRGSSDLESGVAAFQQGRLGIAERHFRLAAEDAEEPTAALYLGRILRRQGRYPEAAQVLNEARKRYPEDADVLRELGHLLAVDLNRPAAAAETYRKAVELNPEASANWIALVRALRAAGDPAAETVLARAPADAQAALRSE